MSVQSSGIHPSASVSPGARLHPSVSVGPFAVVGPHVEIGDGCEIFPHAIVTGHTRLGAKNRVFPHAVIGMVPQDLKYAGEPTRIEIGAGNTFREFVTVHPGTGSDGITRLGDSNLLMVGVHVAHDCTIGNHVIVSNSVGLAGHVSLADHVVVGGMTGFHQFVRVGRNAMVGGVSRIIADVPPYCIVEGVPAYVTRLNAVGLKRAGFDRALVTRLQKAFRILFRKKLPAPAALAALQKELGAGAPVDELVAFFRESKRGVTRGLPSRGARSAGANGGSESD